MRLDADSNTALAARLQHAFERPELLRLALTHRSHSSDNNERLEFLGDALLNLIIAEALYRRFPELREGALSRLRATLVRGETLAEIAREFQLGQLLLLGAGEKRSGGEERESILADAMEAIVAAIYLDAGMDSAAAAVGAWYAGRLAKLNPAVTHKDAKTELQEFLQARRCALPNYIVIDVSGDQHRQRFEVQCEADGLLAPVTGKGASRRTAEQQAARAALQRLRATEKSK